LLPDESSFTDANANVRAGTSVLVSRAGDVIPQIKKRIFNDAAEDEIDGSKEAKMINLEPPSNCPACGSLTTFEFVSSPSQQRGNRKKKDTSEDLNEQMEEEDSSIENETGQVLRCSGPQLLCQPRAVNAMSYAYSPAGLDVKGLSAARIQQLMEQNVIRYPADLFLAFGANASAREGE
jgi:NAD-dependent DNA ligase